MEEGVAVIAANAPGPEHVDSPVTADNPFPNVTVESVNAQNNKKDNLLLNKLQESGFTTRNKLKTGKNVEVGELHGLFNNPDIHEMLDVIRENLPHIDSTEINSTEDFNNALLLDAYKEVRGNSRGVISPKAIQDAIKTRVSKAGMVFSGQDRNTYNRGLSATVRTTIETAQNNYEGDYIARKLGIETDHTSENYAAYMPQRNSGNELTDSKNYIKALKDAETLANTHGIDNDDVHTLLQNSSTTSSDLQKFTSQQESKADSIPDIAEGAVQIGEPVNISSSESTPIGFFPDPYSKKQKGFKIKSKGYQAIYDDPTIMRQVNAITSHLRAGMSDEDIQNTMSNSEFGRLIVHNAILQSESRKASGQKITYSDIANQISRAVAESSNAEYATIPKTVIAGRDFLEDFKNAESQQNFNELTDGLSNLGFTTDVANKNIHPKIKEFIENDNLKGLQNFYNTELDHHESGAKDELHNNIKNSNMSGEDKKLHTKKKSNLTHAEKQAKLKEHQTDEVNKTKEETKQSQLQEHYSNEEVKKQAASILASQIDPDISVADASHEYKEIHELMAQHGHLLSAAQKKGLTSRADSLRNNYNAHTDTTDAAVRKHTQNEERIRAELVESGEYSNPKELEAEVRRRGYIGSQEYDNDKVNESHAEAADAAQTTTRTNTQQQNLDDALDEHVHGQEGRETRARESDVGGYDKLIHADKDGKVSHTTLLGKEGNYKVKETSGTSQAHAEHYAEMSGNENATNKYDADAVDSSALSLGHNPEIASDALKSQAAKEYMQAAHQAQTAPDNSVEKRQAQTTMKQIGEEHPEVLQAFSDLKSKAEQEQERIDNCQPPSPAPISKTTGMALLWACGIHHWVLPENLQGTQDSMGDGGKYLTGQQFQDHMQGEVHMKNGEYTDAEGNVLQDADGNKVQWTTDNSHDFNDGGVYVSGSGIFGTNWNDPDSDAPLSNRDAIKHALGRTMKNIFGHDSDASLHGESPTIEKDKKGIVLNHDAFHAVGDHETDHTGVHDSRKNRTQSGKALREGPSRGSRLADAMHEAGMRMLREGIAERTGGRGLSGALIRGGANIYTIGSSDYVADIANRISRRGRSYAQKGRTTVQRQTKSVLDRLRRNQ